MTQKVLSNHFNGLPVWDGASWPPPQGARVNVRFAMQGDFQIGTVTTIGMVPGTNDIRVAVMTDTGYLVCYTGIGDGMISPSRESSDQEMYERRVIHLASLIRDNTSGLFDNESEKLARKILQEVDHFSHISQLVDLIAQHSQGLLEDKSIVLAKAIQQKWHDL